MPSGGHSRSGPAPDPTSLRSGAAGSSGGWTRMTAPPEMPPAWPLGTPTDAEAALWADLFTRPASSLWERFGLIHEAATHVKTLLAFADGGHSNAALGGLVARQAESLGLTITGAARNRWTWPAPGHATATTPQTSPRPSARRRFGSPAVPASDGSARDADGSVIPARERFRRTAPASPGSEAGPTDETTPA